MNLPLKWVSSFARSPSFQLRVLLLSSAVVFATCPMFDLNEPAAESWEEVTSYTDPTTTHPTSAVTSDMPSNKRNSNQVQPSSLSPPRIRPCLSHAQDGPSSSGEVPLAQSKLDQSPSEGQQSTAVNDVIDGSGTRHVPIARDPWGQASGSGSKVVQSLARINVDTSETDSLLAIEKTQSAKSPAYVLASTGRKPFQSTRYKYLDSWKGVLPVDEVQVPRQLEGCPSSRRGTSTSTAGRVSFQSTRYKYLAGWKGFLPAGHLPFRPRVSFGIPGYPPAICGKGAIRTRWRVSVGTGGYPPADNGYPRRIPFDHL
ncbi:hypothetical protein PGT21_005711 [Puccinia graminis f. sp. tritici]|uniref:Uncharacterized protein n=1 Tax=Puccinia graminis f. sp. tritici TaxID=56615 RepID=A0A5B0PJT3_PUCGR|nr:hypothetical protein PGT21_005711 [Puccinia graminis f. sp. tritici]